MTVHPKRLGGVVLSVLLMPAAAAAHDGPPFPIVTDRVAGSYRVSIWTDPDATDDGSAGGQFWVTLDAAREGGAVPAGTRVALIVSPVDGTGRTVTTPASPTREDFTRQFGAVLLDHEGRYRVQVAIDGPMGPASVDAEVEATYDARPPAIMLAVYTAPFLIVGFLWLKLLLRRRRGS